MYKILGADMGMTGVTSHPLPDREKIILQIGLISHPRLHC